MLDDPLREDPRTSFAGHVTTRDKLERKLHMNQANLAKQTTGNIVFFY